MELPPSVEMPLFPLNTVLFPGTWLPLRVFEPRYRALLQDCLDGDRAFGIALIKFGEEVGGPATPFRIGTRATVEEVAEEGGVYYLLVRGDRRFEIESLMEGAIYPRAWAQFLPPLAHNDRDESLARELRALHEMYVRTLHRAARVLGHNWPPELVAPIPRGGATTVANWVAAALPIEATERQQLLECMTAEAMLALERDLLQIELEKWEALLRRPTPG